jgi:hypothetical protein
LNFVAKLSYSRSSVSRKTATRKEEIKIRIRKSIEGNWGEQEGDVERQREVANLVVKRIL